MVTDHQTTRTGTATRTRVRFAEATRVSTRHDAVWRDCTGCGALAPLAPDTDRCDECTKEGRA